MKTIAIVSDSTCDLSPDLIKKLDIKIVPLYVNFPNESFKDGVDMNASSLYQKVDQLGVLPKTAAASPDDFTKLFNELFLEYEEIFYTGISSKMSSTLQNAFLAKSLSKNQDKIFLLDSKNLSTGIGLIILKACKYRDLGLSGEEIVSRLNDIVPKVRSQFAIETMEYLYKGGRCNSLVHFVGKVFKIKPIIVVRDGLMSVGKKPRGQMRRALDGLLDYLKQDLAQIDSDAIFITHSIALDSASYLKEEVKKIVGDIPIYETQAGCVISSHCGKGTIGILYIKDEINEKDA